MNDKKFFAVFTIFLIIFISASVFLRIYDKNQLIRADDEDNDNIYNNNTNILPNNSADHRVAVRNDADFDTRITVKDASGMYLGFLSLNNYTSFSDATSHIPGLGGNGRLKACFSHNKVVELRADESLYYDYGGVTGLENFEMYIFSDDGYYNALSIVLWNAGTRLIYLRIYNGYLDEYSGGSYNHICTWSDMTWHHLRLDMYYATDVYCIFLDDEPKGVYDFEHSNSGSSQTTKITFSYYFGSGDRFWIDAVDAGWDDGYYINRNKNLDLSHTLFDFIGAPAVSTIIPANSINTITLDDTKIYLYEISSVSDGSIQKTGVIYSSTDEISCGNDKLVYVSLYDASGLGVDESKVRIYVDNERKQSPVYVEPKICNVTVLDYFNNSLYSQNIDFTQVSELNINLDTKPLKLKNELENSTLLTISHDNINYSEYIAKNEIKTYILSSTTYNISYYLENSSLVTIEGLDLSNPQLVVMNSSYQNVYFSILNSFGLPISHDQIKFYINSERKTIGLNIIPKTSNILIQDYFNTTLFNRTINFDGVKEYNIYLNLSSLKIKSDLVENTLFNITKNNLTYSEYILPGDIEILYLFNTTYNISYCLENGTIITIENIDMNEPHFLILNSSYQSVYFSLFDESGLGIDSNMFRFYINNERKTMGLNILPKTSNIIVLDYFNTTLFNQTINFENYTEYNIYISIYNLIIDNKLINSTTLYIIHNNINYTDYISKNEIKTYSLSPSLYNISYYLENGTIVNIQGINMSEPHYITLNSSYKNIYFSFFDESGLGIDGTMFKMYINGERKDIGLNMIKKYSNVVVIDYFNTTLFNQTIYFANYTEYNIYLPVYNLMINNNYTESMKLKIYRSGAEDYALEQVIPSQSAISYRFLANITYRIEIYYTNGTLADNKTVELDKNNKLISFGYYEKPVPASFHIEGVQSADLLIIIALFSATAFTSASAIKSIKRTYYPISNNTKVRKKDLEKIEREYNYYSDNPVNQIRKKMRH